MENNREDDDRLAETAKKFEEILNDNFYLSDNLNPSAREVGEYWVERLRQEEARADLHATLNRKVADALGLSFGSDWACLPKLVTSLRAENERLRGFVGHIMTLGLLRGSPRLRDEALRILDGVELSDIDDSKQDFNNRD